MLDSSAFGPGGPAPDGGERCCIGTVQPWTTLPTWLWRPLAFVAIGVALVLICWDLLPFAASTGFGLTLTPLGHGTYLVNAVEPRSPADRAGIRAGARVTLAQDRFANREQLLGIFVMPGAGGTIALLPLHGRPSQPIVLRAPPHTRTPARTAVWYAYQTVRFTFVLVAALIVFRRAERADARALATFLVGIVFAYIGSPRYGVVLAGALAIVSLLIVPFALMQAVRFAALFPQPSVRGPRRLLLRINPIASAVAMIGNAFWPFTALVLDAAVPRQSMMAMDVALQLSAVYLVAGLAVGFWVGAREAPAADRPRLRWVALSIGLGVLSFIMAILDLVVQWGPAAQTPFVLATSVIPIGTAYAILRHRMLDIGFVINRAIVFGIMSAFVVAAFTLLEFLLGKYVTTIGHVQSAALEALLALAIGLSVARIHRRVDRFVDAVFFRERHRAEAALRSLARETSFVDDPVVLADRVVAAVDRHAAANGSALYLHDGNGGYVPMRASLQPAPDMIGHNDAAIVRMRASHRAVDLDELADEVERPAVPGKIAFPMIVRGQLVGALACGQKRSLEEYAPDERATLAELAHAAGVAFDTLQTNALRQAFERAVMAGEVAPLDASSLGFQASRPAPTPSP